MKIALKAAWLFYLQVPSLLSYSQNINGEKILIGRESITIINFPDKVLNINFSDDDAYDYYIPKRREEKSISIQFNKEQQSGPNTGLLVNEGGRSHMFRMQFDSTYNINDDSRPPLWYDHSDLKELKAFVKKQHQAQQEAKEGLAVENAAAEQAARQEEKKLAEEKAVAMKEQQEAAEKRAAAAEEQRRLLEEKQQEEAALLAKAKQEVAENETRLEAARKKEAEMKIAAEKKAAAEREALAQQQAAEAKRLKEMEAEQAAKAAAREQEIAAQKEQQDAAAIARAREQQAKKAAQDSIALVQARQAAAEKQKKQEEALARKRAAEKEAAAAAAAAVAQQQAEQKAAQIRLEKLEKERQQLAEEKAYSEIGLWQRYGKNGIDVYNVPPGQMELVNADYFIAADTLRNFRIADSLIRSNGTDLLNLAAEAPINKGVNFTLEQIYFRDIHTYYKIKVDNRTDEDFLLGKTSMYWYDEKAQPKMIVKGSYLTYISFYPIIRPHTQQYIVFVTRSPNMTDAESLVLFIEDRRKQKGTTSIVVNGDVYRRELAKLEESLTRDLEHQQGTDVQEPVTEQKTEKKKKRRKNK